ncbi:MAG: 50S ribosomal protein L4 [Candidatus Saccharimonadales bacterium]
MATPTFTKSGSKAVAAASLDKSVFGIEVTNHELLKLAYSAYLANGRDNLAVTKTRGLVSGGGRKPWKQKGTGRARFGSSRNPIWRSGGIVFGPTGEENYTKQLNVKAKRLAIRQALSLKAAAGKVVIIEALPIKEGKTSELANFLSKIGANRSVLLAVENKTPELDKASSNLGNVKVSHARYLNVYNILNADTLVITKEALSIVNEWLGGKK